MVLLPKGRCQNHDYQPGEGGHHQNRPEHSDCVAYTAALLGETSYLSRC